MSTNTDPGSIDSHRRLMDGEGQIPYEFDAAYTLADLGAGPRIVAIAHNETPRLLGRLGG